MIQTSEIVHLYRREGEQVVEELSRVGLRADPRQCAIEVAVVAWEARRLFSEEERRGRPSAEWIAFAVEVAVHRRMIAAGGWRARRALQEIHREIGSRAVGHPDSLDKPVTTADHGGFQPTSPRYYDDERVTTAELSDDPTKWGR